MQRAKIRNRVLSAAGILGFVGAIVAFDLGCPGDENSGVPVVAQVVVGGPGAVRVGGTVTLTVTLRNPSGITVEGVPVTWRSSNSLVATVTGDASGAYVTGVSLGSVTITATSQFVDSPPHQVTVSNVPVASVTVSGPGSVALGSSIQLVATMKDDAGNILNGRTVDWISSNSNLASVSSNGSVTGVALGGPVTITATSEFVTGSAQVTVTGPPVASVTLTGLASVDIGFTLGIAVTLKDAAGNVLTNRQVSWSSSNSNIATVSGGNIGANVTGVAAGTVTITATSENVPGSIQITVNPPASATLSGRVIDYVTGAGIAGATVNFRDAGNVFWGSTTTGSDGSFTFTSTGISNGVYVEGVATGYVTGRIFVSRATTGATTYTEPVPLVPTSSMPGGISGTVKNAVNGTGISGATVQLFDNIFPFNPIATQTSDGSGNFTFSGLAAGTYRLSASATGFTTASRTGVAVGTGSVTSGQDVVLSPSGTNVVRIVLTWGNAPSDLDSHLTGPNADGTRFHIYYGSRGSLTAAPFAFLDIDDTSAFGPETITITQMNSGLYRYSVHDYSNRSSTTSTALGASGARVEVYTSTGLAQIFFVPGGPGTLWTVFEMSGTLANPVITPINTKTFVSDPTAVTSPPIADATDAGLIGQAVRAHPKPPR